jgi:NADH:ubiquinone oxidoreductase subunit 3 (subunit A)
MATWVTTWFPIAIALGFAGIVVGVMVSINGILGPKRPSLTKS